MVRFCVEVLITASAIADISESARMRRLITSALLVNALTANALFRPAIISRTNTLIACANNRADVARIIDEAALIAGGAGVASDASAAEVAAKQIEQQDGLKKVYDELVASGALRGYGSVSDTGLLPAAEIKTVTTEEQLRLTGLPTSAFAPPRGNQPFDIIAGAGAAWLLAWTSKQFDIDLGFVLAAVVSTAVADRLLLRGAIIETATRTLRPGYTRTVREHEAGHFLVAYLLGCPIEACVLDPFAAAKDGRIMAGGAAGTVFFDPELGRAMSGGRLTREIIDRYSVVVMAGIAAEAAQNGKAEGGLADETALVQLLGSLDNGRTWDLPRVRNQARWAASQALLLLREHGAAYKALCVALERGEGVGKCVLAIEEALDSDFGRNGELPAEARARRRDAAAAAAAAERGVVAPTTAAAAATTSTTSSASDETTTAEQPSTAAVDARLEEIDARLEEIKQRLAREEDTWS